MVCLKDVCTWFQGLASWKRIDIICGLFQTCIPLELRFFGSVLEELCGKDFQSLREAENKANHRTEVDKDSPANLIRAQLIIKLSLLHSHNTKSANTLCDWIEAAVEEFYTVQDADEKSVEEIFLVLTLAIHHPALAVRDRMRVTEHYESLEKRFAEKLAKVM